VRRVFVHFRWKLAASAADGWLTSPGGVHPSPDMSVESGERSGCCDLVWSDMASSPSHRV
jgi:hypothetical protein